MIDMTGSNRSSRRTGNAWGVPLGLAALALVAGLLFFNWSGDRTTTASNTDRGTAQSTPAASPTAPAPRSGSGG
jgi:uncharacterized membrane protein YebE (DUF533 family)